MTGPSQFFLYQFGSLYADGPLAVGDGIEKLVELAKAGKESYVILDQTVAPPYEQAVRDGLLDSTEPQVQNAAAKETSRASPAVRYPVDRGVLPPRESVEWRAYLPGGSLRTALAVILVLAMPIIGLAAYVIFSGRKKQFWRVMNDLFRRLFSS